MNVFRTVVMSVVVAALAVTLSAEDKARELKLQQAIDLIESKGDLAKATPLLEDVASSADRALAARGLLHLAQAQERFGKPDALSTYQRIVRGFGGLNEAEAVATTVAAARAHIASLDQRTAGVVLRQVALDDFGNVSPDGRYVTYTFWRTGDLVRQDVDSGKTRILTKNGSANGVYADGAIPSPDSRLIAYGWLTPSKPYELRVIGRDGGEPRVVYADTQGADAITPFGWSPDGKSIFVVIDKGRDRAVSVIPAAGGSPRLVARVGNSAKGFCLSPDGKFVAYDRLVTPTGADSDIYQVAVDTGVESRLVEHLADDYMLGWFPQGDRILFGSDRGGSEGMWAEPVVNGRPAGEPTLVRRDIGTVALQNNSVLNCASFARDGSFFYHVINRTTDVYVGTLASSAGRAEPITRLEGRFTGHEIQAAWSPTGNRIAYVQEPATRPTGPSREQKLAIKTIATGAVELKTLPLQSLQNPTWLPDERSVIVQGRTLEGSQGLHAFNLESGVLTTIASREPSNDIRRTNPSVLPDGRLFFFWSSATAPARTGIGSRDLQTGVEKLLEVPGATAYAVGPDGKFAAVVRGTVSSLSILRTTDGTEEPIGATAKALAVFANALTWSPDGRSVFVSRQSDASPGHREIWRVPLGGGEPANTGISVRGIIRTISAHPDGRRLAISAISDNSETWVLQNIPPKK